MFLKILFRHKQLFDLSNYPKDSKFFYSVNEKVIGKMKDFSEGKINDEFIGLKSKMYSMKNIGNKGRGKYCDWVWWIQRHFN